MGALVCLSDLTRVVNSRCRHCGVTHSAYGRGSGGKLGGVLTSEAKARMGVRPLVGLRDEPAKTSRCGKWGNGNWKFTFLLLSIVPILPSRSVKCSILLFARLPSCNEKILQDLQLYNGGTLYSPKEVILAMEIPS